jgi:hypothetical protein
LSSIVFTEAELGHRRSVGRRRSSATLAVDDKRARAVVVPDPAAYATVADFEDYVEGWATDDEDVLKRTLHRASRDVDRFVGPCWSMESNGLRFGDLTENPKKLSDEQRAALVAATCAQAEYRIEKGEDWFVHDQYKQTNGPDFATVGRLNRFGPKAREELRYSGLSRAQGGRLVR